MHSICDVMCGMCFKDLESGSFGLEHYMGHMMVTDDNRNAVLATNK